MRALQNCHDHLPAQKQEELRRIVKTIRRLANVEMIILFGSYARGDFVDSDVYREGHITYEYQSDYDLLVIVRDETRERDYGLWHRVEAELHRDKGIRTPVSLIVDTIDSVNDQLSDGRYFYADVQKEGVALYNSKKCRLLKPRTLTSEERQTLATVDYELWFPRAEVSLQIYAFTRENG